MAQNRVDNIQINAPKNIDNKRGVWDNGSWRAYNNITEALDALPVGERYLTLTIPIMKAGRPVDYWWELNLTDSGLIEKIVGNIYTLPTASPTTLGGVKVGESLTINPSTGELNINGGGGGGSGTVTSVGLSSTDLNISNSPLTTSGTIVANIKNSAVSFAKMQSISSGTLLGRGTTGTGTIQTVTVGSGLTLSSSNVLTATGGGGGSQTLQQTLNLGRVGDRMQIIESMEIPIDPPATINSGSIWVGSGTSGGGGGGGYTLPIATATVLGGVKVGSGLSIDPITGVLTSSGGGYTLPIASASTLGGIRIGSGLTVDPATGIVTATGSGGGSVTSVTSANADISVATSTTTPVLTLNSGLAANQIVKRYGNGGVALNSFGDNISASTQGNIIYEAGSTGFGTHDFKVNSAQTGFKINTDRSLSAPRYASGGTTPTMSGTTKMMVVDTNGLLGFENKPALSQSLQQTLNIGNVGDVMQITGSLQIPTSAPSPINTGNIWVGTGTTVGSVVKSKVNGLTENTSTSLSIGSAQASSYIISTNASAISATISSGTALTSIFIRQGGVGKVTFTGSGVTVLVKPSKQARTEGQNAVVEIFYETATRVVITGDLDNV